MESWHELKDVQLPITYGNLLTIFVEYDMKLAREYKKLIDSGNAIGGIFVQAQRHAISNLLERIIHGKETILGEPE